ncbi:MAG: glycosyltransferase [Candidatus Pacebacteria bacterium]|nr:glycosyltransferase [Candidatus Paceibacterota bacterium]
MKEKKEKQELSIVIPAFQKGKCIKSTIKSLIDYFPQAEIIVVNDGSFDNTKEIQSIFKDRIAYLENEINRGKGYSLRKGFARAQGEYIIFTDADLPFSVKDIEKIFQNLKQGSLITIAHREKFYNDKFYKKLLRPFLYLMLKILFGFQYSDTQCGLKGFAKEVGQKLFGATIVNGFAIDIEILYLAKKLGYPVDEILVQQEVLSLSSSSFNLKEMLKMVGDIFVIKFHTYGL